MASSELGNGSESGHEGDIKPPKGPAALAQEADESPRLPTEKESSDCGLGNQKPGGDDAAGDIHDSFGKGGERQTDGSNGADSDEEGEISVSPTLSDEDAPPLQTRHHLVKMMDGNQCGMGMRGLTTFIIGSPAYRNGKILVSQKPRML